MSENEQDAIVGRVAREHSDAVKKLASLEAKARSYASHMRIIANELSPSSIGVVPDYDKNKLIALLEKCPNRDEVAALLTEIAETKTTVHDLGQSLRKMGIGV